MKKILGLDLGTNSIGWALVSHDFNKKEGEINGIGSRVIPMSQDIMGKFESGQSHSQTAERTHYRSVRRSIERHKLRRERLHRVLNCMGFLPEHYTKEIDFDKKPGKFIEGKEPKINYNCAPSGQHQFIFMDSFHEMADEFRKQGYENNMPLDWTIYYLRKKALTAKISKNELAWVLLNFNQKRGYFQLRGEEEESDNTKQKEYCELTVMDVIPTGESVQGKPLYNVIFTNGWSYDKSIVNKNEWIGKTKEFIVTTSLTKRGDTKRTYKAVDSTQDWLAIKAKTEQNIKEAGQTVGEYIYETLLTNPNQKIRGKLVRTVERRLYKKELTKILEKQREFHPELNDKTLYDKCLLELYPNNEAHRNHILQQDMVYLLLEDIIFYQRPLKSKKSTINKCPYEKRVYKKPIINEGGTFSEIKVEEGLQVISKSHPLYQEFRLWQFISNLKIFKKELSADVDVTQNLMTREEDWVELYEYLNQRKEVEQKNILDYLVKSGRIEKSEKENYRWNYVEDKKYTCNETRSLILNRLKKALGNDADDYLTRERENHLWHIIYSVKDKKQFEKSLKNFAINNDLDCNAFVESFKSIPPFENDYGAYSHKAISRLLPLLRRGKYWSESDIDSVTRQRIDKLISGEVDETINNRVREHVINFNSVEDFRGIPVWLACYIVYGRHSETGNLQKWNSPADIDHFLNEFKQHSLRNPIVEQVVTEALRVVRDIWKHYGHGSEDFFNEIHLELGRELKNPAGKRQEMTRRINENENTNQRIRLMLEELMHDESMHGEVRPFSPSQQELLKIYEEGVFLNPDARYDTMDRDEVEKIRKTASPTATEIKKYKLWLEQGYRSPYTGQNIPLSKLFTTDYQIEHIIPQARFFDDSLSNKVICESEINTLKSAQTAFEFLQNERGRIVEMSNGRKVRLFTIDEYQNHCQKYFGRNRIKLMKLMSEEIPESFIERQMNDSRYISKFVKSLLNNIVRKHDEIDSMSVNFLTVEGALTSKLKSDWGLHDKWNELIAPRFKRLNEITNSDAFGRFDASINCFRPDVPLDQKKGFNKKRIDHRHHAMDALVIACATRKHIQYLNSLNNEKVKYELREGIVVKNKQGDYTKSFCMPWEGFPIHALDALSRTIISFKQNIRVINKTTNRYQHWEKKNGQPKKVMTKQTKGTSWAIRKSLHKESVYGKVSIQQKREVSFANGIKDWKNLVDRKLRNKVKKLVGKGYSEKEIQKHFKENPVLIEGKPVKRVEIYDFTNNTTAKREPLTEITTRKKLESITDSGIRNILQNHLENYTDEKGNEDYSTAFSQEGIDTMNANIVQLNDGKKHKPVFHVRLYEKGNRFPVGTNGINIKKFVEAAKGTNLFFAIYVDEETGKRSYETIPLNEVIEHQKWRATLSNLEQKDTPLIPVKPKMGRFLFYLSPNDLVYVPTLEEQENPNLVDIYQLTAEQVHRVYKMVSSSLSQAFFIRHDISIPIFNKVEFSPLNKMEKSLGGTMIKEVCWKINVDRLGHISSITK